MISWQALWNMFPFSWKTRKKRSFWKSGSSVFEEASQKTLVLEVWIFSFRGSVAENTRFGSLDLQFLRMSHRICSFWKSGRVFSFWRKSLRGGLKEKTLLIFPLGAASSHCLKIVPAVTASRMLPRGLRFKNVTAVTIQEYYRRHRFKNTASRMLPQPALQECYRSHSFKIVADRMSPFQECDRSHRFHKTVTAVTASRMRPPSPLQECYRSYRFKKVTALTASRTSQYARTKCYRSQRFQKCDRSHRFKNVTAVIVSRKFPLVTSWRTSPQSPLQECDHSHRFKNDTAVTASRMWPKSPLQEGYRSHRFRNVTTVTPSRRLPLVTASRIVPRSPLQEGYRRHRFKNVTAVTVSRMWPQSPLQICYRWLKTLPG